MLNKRTLLIRDFVLDNVSEHPKDISTITAAEFNISRQAAHRHVSKLVDEGLLVAKGVKRNREFALASLVDIDLTFSLDNLKLAEDKIWRDLIVNQLVDLTKNLINICQYGFTEMVNNVIDHSEGTKFDIVIKQTHKTIELRIEDDGVGIFNKIQKAFNLDDPLHSLLELSKGKLTTDPDKHTGEGIFFTSRMFDLFVIRSGKIFFAHADAMDEGDFLLEHKEHFVSGTSIKMCTSTHTERTVQQIFNKYTENYGFTKTLVPVFLSAYGDENLVSRSQAKRLLSRFEIFKEIILDFSKVDSIGQAFADEVFRVFKNQHPDINVYPIKTNEQITKMIKHVTGGNLESR